MSATAFGTGEVVGYRRRPVLGVVLLAFGLSLGFGGFLLTHLDIDGTLPPAWPWVLVAWFGLGALAYVGVRIRLPYADPVLLPATFLLTGLGLAMIHRIDLINDPPRTDAQTQSLWVVLGVVVALAAIFLVRDYRVLGRFPYVLFLAGLVLLLLPLTPLGIELNGSRIWIRVFGYSFQPAELAKIVLSLAFAGYLADTKDVLANAGPKVLGITLPRARDLGPIAVMWIASLLVLIYQKDLGTSMLFFGLFVAMVFVATGRVSWVMLGAALFAAGGWFAYQRFGYVRVRVSSWLDPFSNYDENYQVIQGQFGFAYGGLLGRGWGLGRPGLTPLAKSDFITAAIGEELGITGLVAVILVYALIVARGLRTALSATEPFGKLLSAGLSLVFALQVFAIMGGVTRLLPLTGLTTPFMSQGGSSMVANWLVMAVMLVVSHDARKPVVVTAEAGDVALLSADATQVIPVRAAHPEPRPAPRTASSASSADAPIGDEPPAHALPDEEATAALGAVPDQDATAAIAPVRDQDTTDVIAPSRDPEATDVMAPPPGATAPIPDPTAPAPDATAAIQPVPPAVRRLPAADSPQRPGEGAAAARDGDAGDEATQLFTLDELDQEEDR